jgi:tRNA A22 N-methylase
MKKIFLLSILVILGVAPLFAAINECQVDLYYANGVLMEERENIVQQIWEQEIDKLKQSYSQLNASIISP